MNNLNSILIEGNLVRDPLFRSTAKGTPICTFRLASNRYLKKDTGYEQEVSFFDVETWSRLAENCYNLGHKGRGVRVVGRLKENRWPGSDGKSHSRVMIVAEHVEFRPDFKKDGDASVGRTNPTTTETAHSTDTDDDVYGAISESTETAMVFPAEELEETAF